MSRSFARRAENHATGVRKQHILQRGRLPQRPHATPRRSAQNRLSKVDADQQVSEMEASRGRLNRVKSSHRASQQTRAHFPILASICTPQCASTTVVARSLITASSI
jgi:hypothetical protein